jgi:hypothetical protein
MCFAISLIHLAGLSVLFQTSTFLTTHLPSLSPAVHFSFNSIVEDDDHPSGPSSYSAEATEDYLAMVCSREAPNHELHLKPGAICSLMRNLSPALGLVKNKRVVVGAPHSRFIEVRVLDPGHHPCQTHCIPRINFDFRPPYMSYTIRRKQFPLNLAYATTFNSCQGLTFDKVVIDGRCDVFAHGQLYTALSRVHSCHDALVYIPDD